MSLPIFIDTVTSIIATIMSYIVGDGCALWDVNCIGLGIAENNQGSNLYAVIILISLPPVTAILHIHGLLKALDLGLPTLPAKFAKNKFLSVVIFLYVTPWLVNYYLFTGQKSTLVAASTSQKKIWKVCGEQHGNYCPFDQDGPYFCGCPAEAQPQQPHTYL